MSLADVPTLVVEIALTTDPLNTTPSWTDVSQYVRHVNGVQIQRGRPSELADFQPGSCTLTLSNRDRRFDPRHSAGPYFGNLKPGKAIRVRALWSAVNYPLFVGFIESWPQEYADGNKDATVTLECFDGLTVLSEMVQPDPVFKYTKTTIGSCVMFLRNCDGQTWYDESGNGYHAYRVSDPLHSATSFGQIALRYRIKQSKPNDPVAYGVLAGPPQGQVPSGVNGPAAISTSLAVGLSSPSVTGGRFQPASPISLGANWSLSLWFACNLPSIAGQPAPLINIINDVSRALFVADSSSNIAMGDDGVGITLGGEGASTSAATGGLNAADGKPHHGVITVSGGTAILYIDGVYAGTNAGGATPATFLAIDLDTYSRAKTFPFASTLDTPPVSNIAVQDVTAFSKTLSAAEVLGLYQRGNGQLSDSSSARVSRLIADTDWPSAWVNTTTSPRGQCVDYTPAFQGTLDALAEVAATEQGRIFVDQSGVLQLLGRYYQQEVTAGKTSQATFADDNTGVPYKQIATDYSSREVQNDITVVATLGVSATSTDATSITSYRRQPTTISTLLPGVTEALDMANGLVTARKDPVTRLSRPIEVQPARKVANWPTVLGLEIGERVTLKLTPMRTVGSQISAPMVIEGIQWDITRDDWHVGFDLAPVQLESGSVGWFTLDDATFGVLDNDRLGF